MQAGSIRSASSICLALLIGGVARAGDDAQQWLQRMEDALAARNYQGVFVHEHGGQTETLRIVHRASGGPMAERIVSLDGSGREFIRRGAELICYLPDQKTVLVEQAQDVGLLLGELRKLELVAAGQYTVSEVARTRISGRSARLIVVEPRDGFRYGYRLWIDESTAMPLKTQLRTGNGRVIEQIVFTELTLPQNIADRALEAEVDARNYRWLRHEAAIGTGNSTWQARQLPPGFRMTVQATQILPGGKHPVTHLVYSDGLASVSVFVEELTRLPAPGDSPSTSNDALATAELKSLGSSSAYSTVVQGHRITAIGEVPPDTVRSIARSMLGSPRTAAPPAARVPADGRVR